MMRVDITYMSESSEESRDKRRPQRSASEDRQKSTKLFITNLDGKADTKELQNELRKLFEKYGTVESLVAKRNRNAEYCFAFAEMKEYSAAQQCVKSYDQSSLGGKQIKVQFQDDGKRRKDSNKGCFTCGKMGHFARECQSGLSRGAGDSSRGYRRRSRSRSRSQESQRGRKGSKRRHRERSESSDRGKSRSPKGKKERKNRSRDREEKRKKKHKRSSSGS